MKYLLLAGAVGLLCASASDVQAQTTTPEQGVYEYVVRSAEGSVDSVADSVQASMARAGWQIVSDVRPGSPESCPYSARVILGYRPSYGDVVARANLRTGAFGLLDRINIFEDEDGVHVSAVNQRNIIRTVLMNDTGYADFVDQHMQSLRGAIEGGATGSPSQKQYGQIRDRGYIGRTMGVVAGGRFDGKVEEVAVVPGKPLSAVSDLIEERLAQVGPTWGTGLAFRLDLPDQRTVLFGTTGTPLDSRSFEIVGAGSDDARERFSCPGLAHAAAYPLEIVATSTDEGVAIRMVDAMYRMKMYFEDAGKISFMKNMTMPGSIASEIEDKLELEGLQSL